MRLSRDYQENILMKLSRDFQEFQIFTKIIWTLRYFRWKGQCGLSKLSALFGLFRLSELLKLTFLENLLRSQLDSPKISLWSQNSLWESHRDLNENSTWEVWTFLALLSFISIHINSFRFILKNAWFKYSKKWIEIKWIEINWNKT